MSIFREMHPYREVGSWWNYTELRRMLSEAISRGFVEEVPVLKKHPMVRTVNWYRDKESGEIYYLVPPDPGDERSRGCWDRVDMEELMRSDHMVQ